MYCVATKPTPLLNTPDFQGAFSAHPPLDDQGLLRALEMIAFPQTKFKILNQLPHYILEVSTEEYPYGPLYIDRRFVSFTEEDILERNKILPHREIILEKLHSSIGSPYIWGGNVSKGIPEIHKFYPSMDLSKLNGLKGLDCSGLLYEATQGYTPRNTSELMHFGTVVPTLDDVKPLDILVWPGHVLIFLSKNTIIESRLGLGVITGPLETYLPEILTKSYMIRRFISL